MVKNKVIKARVTEQMYKDFVRIANKTDMKPSQILRYMIEGITKPKFEDFIDSLKKHTLKINLQYIKEKNVYLLEFNNDIIEITPFQASELFNLLDKETTKTTEKVFSRFIRSYSVS